MPEAPKQKSPPREGEIDPWSLAGLGLQFGVGLVVGAYAGQYLDRRLDIAPWGTIAGAFLLGGGLFVSSYRRLMARSRQAAQEHSTDRTSGDRS